MSAFKAWACVALFGGLGTAVLLGVDLPRDPDCELPQRCTIDTMAQIQEMFGSLPLAGLLYFSAAFSYVWWMYRD